MFAIPTPFAAAFPRRPFPTLFDPEVWMPIPDYLGYEVSSHARMRSFWKHGGRTKSRLSSEPQRFMAPQILEPNGRFGFCIRKDGRYKTIQVAHWMLRAFVAECPGWGWHACHNDGDVLNNDLRNIRWDTGTANMLDRLDHGGNPLVILDAEKVKMIRERLANGEKTGAIAVDFGVCRATITSIKNGNRWSSVA